MTEEISAGDAYLRLREDWHAMLSEPEAPMRSPRKDALFAALWRAWARIPAGDRAAIGAYCVGTYH